MVSIVNVTAGAVKIIGHLIDVVEDVHEMASPDGQVANAHCASTMYKVGLLTLKMFQAIANYRGSSTSTQIKFKNIEQVISCIGIPIEMHRKIVTEMQKPEEERSALGIIEKAIIYPTLMMLRLDNEACQLKEKEFCEMAIKDKNATRPTYGLDCDGQYVKTGSRKIDPKECQSHIQELEKDLPYLNAAEAYFQLNGLQKTYSVLAGQLINLARHRPNFPLPPIVIGQDQANNQNNNARPYQGEDIDALDIVRAHRIPQRLQDDSFLSQNLCAISGQPIRFPVKDKTTAEAEAPTYYEFENIYQWVVVRGHTTSPITRQPLYETDLVVDTDLQLLIEQRLQSYQGEIGRFVDDLVSERNKSSSSSSSSSSSFSSTSSSSSSSISLPSNSSSSSSSSSVSSPDTSANSSSSSVDSSTVSTSKNATAPSS